MRQNQKYFPLFDRDGQAAAALPHRLEHEGRRSAPHHRRQRARGAAAARGRALLLRPGPQDCGWKRACRSSPRSSTTTSSAASSSGCSASSCSPARSRGSSRRDAAAAERAAWLSKADLLTGMVGEFPELQGVMGRYYALHDGEPREVADAIEAHYRPRFAGDRAAGGSRRLRARARRQARRARRHVRHRPAADRRQGSVRPAPRRARRGAHPRRAQAAALAVTSWSSAPTCRRSSWSASRATSRSRDSRRCRSTRCSARVRRGSTWCRSSSRRCKAFQALPEAESLAAANKRVANILKQARGQGRIVRQAPSAQTLKEPAELALFDSVGARPRATPYPLYERGDYTGYLKSFAVLKAAGRRVLRQGHGDGEGRRSAP